ncbi:MAG TPA: hypothetical protein VK631_20225 [Solirubrobacteraceae bacterium]|nr:hypothetical protein [Solirubrobacteraceae bacterium]
MTVQPEAPDDDTDLPAEPVEGADDLTPDDPAGIPPDEVDEERIADE